MNRIILQDPYPYPTKDSWLTEELNSRTRWIETEIKNCRRKVADAMEHLRTNSLTDLRSDLITVSERVSWCLYWVGREEERQIQRARDDR